MDLYEAMKNGATADSLKADFNKQLAAALVKLQEEEDKRVAEEKAAAMARAEEIAEVREYLIANLIDYGNVVFEDEDMTEEEEDKLYSFLEKYLISFEEKVAETKKILKKGRKAKDSSISFNLSDVDLDLDIIQKFVKNL